MARCEEGGSAATRLMSSAGTGGERGGRPLLPGEGGGRLPGERGGRPLLPGEGGGRLAAAERAGRAAPFGGVLGVAGHCAPPPGSPHISDVPASASAP